MPVITTDKMIAGGTYYFSLAGNVSTLAFDGSTLTDKGTGRKFNTIGGTYFDTQIDAVNDALGFVGKLTVAIQRVSGNAITKQTALQNLAASLPVANPVV